MRRRKPFKNVDANLRDRKQEIARNDPPDSKSDTSYSPTASIVSKTRHLVNDTAFNFLSSSLELKVARNHEERQKKARAEKAKARERSINEKSNIIVDKKNNNTISSRFGSQTKTPKISNCTGNESTAAESSNPGGPKNSNDGKPLDAKLEGGNSKAKQKMDLKKPKLPTIEEEDPMQLSDLIGADQRDALRTHQQQLFKDSHPIDKQNIRGSDMDNETKDQQREEREIVLIDSNKIDVAKLHDQRMTSTTHVAEVIAAALDKVDTEIPDLSTRLGKDLEIRDEYHEDMELVATDDDSLRSSSASSLEESCDVDENPNTSPEVPKVVHTPSSEAVDSKNANYRSPVTPVASSTSQRLPQSGPLSREIARSLTKQFRTSPMMPNSTSFSRSPVALMSANRQPLFPNEGSDQPRRTVDTSRGSEGRAIVCDDPDRKKDVNDEEGRVQKPTLHAKDGSPDMTVNEILRTLMTTPPENAAAVRAMLASCKEDESLSDDLLRQGFVVEINQADAGGSCGEASELTCDIDGRNAHQKRKKKQEMSKARKRSKPSNIPVKEAEQHGPAFYPSPGTKATDPKKAPPDNALREASPEKDTAIPTNSEEAHSRDNSIPSVKTMPVTVEMKRTLGVTPPTNPYLGFEISNQKIPSFETAADINSPYLWTAQRAGHFIIEPIFQLVDGNFYRHPPLPPGWTISISQSRNMPFYHHPDFGSTWYPPVALPMTEGNFAGRRMLVTTHANENMIPWSGFVSQFGKKNLQLASTRGKHTPESMLSHAVDREGMSSGILRSVLHRETPMLPTVSRNVAFSDHTGCSPTERNGFHTREEHGSVPSNDGLRAIDSQCSAQKHDTMTTAEKKILSEINQEPPFSESCKAVPSDHSKESEVDSRRGDAVEHIETVSKFVGKSLVGKVGLMQSSHLSSATSATSRSTSQSIVSRTLSVSASSSEKPVRGILDTPGRSIVSGGESRVLLSRSAFADDFRGVGFDSEEFRRKQKRSPDVGLEDVDSGVVNLGTRHVCMSHEKHSARSKTDCSDVASGDNRKSKGNETGSMNEESGLSSRQRGFESPISHQSDDQPFPAPDDDHDFPVPDDDNGFPALDDDHDQSSCEEDEAHHPEKLVADREGSGSRDSDESGTNGDFDSPDDGQIDHYQTAAKASSVFVPRLKLSVLHEANSQMPGGADDASVESWRSRASSLMSSSSHRVRFPPMPICSLQALEICPVVKVSRSRKTITAVKAKKGPKKSLSKHASKATR